jgi:hypothetical protein
MDEVQILLLVGSLQPFVICKEYSRLVAWLKWESTRQVAAQDPKFKPPVLPKQEKEGREGGRGREREEIEREKGGKGGREGRKEGKKGSEGGREEVYLAGHCGTCL